MIFLFFGISRSFDLFRDGLRSVHFLLVGLANQEPLNGPFLNGLFSRWLLRGKTAHEGTRGNGPLRRGNALLRQMDSFRAPRNGQAPKKYINIKKWPQKLDLRPPPPSRPWDPSLKILYALYFAGKNDASIKNSGPKPPSQTPSLTPSEILYVGFLYVLFLFPKWWKTARNIHAEVASQTAFQCHAEGGATKGGVSKCEQMQTNADKRWQTQANAEAQTQANVDKRKQTLTPPFIVGFFYTPLCNPLTDRLTGHFCGHFHGHLHGTFRGSFRGESSQGRRQGNSTREQTWTNANKRLHPPLLWFWRHACRTNLPPKNF